MAKPNRLPELAQERGQTVTEMIAAALKARGSIQGAAQHIGVSPWTITRWMLHNNYTVITHQVADLVRGEQQEAPNA